MNLNQQRIIFSFENQNFMSKFSVAGKKKCGNSLSALVSYTCKYNINEDLGLWRSTILKVSLDVSNDLLCY